VITFEYDQNKSQSNYDKHGIDFETAKLIWLDPSIIEVPARSIDEPRYLVVGRISDKFWSAIITYRNEQIRIISVRRARPEEVKMYES